MSCGRFEIKRYFPQTNLLIAQWGELSLFSIKCRKTVIVTLSCAVLFGKIKKSAVKRRISFRWQMASMTIIVTLSCAILFEFKDGFDCSKSNEVAVFEEFALNLFVIDVEPV